MSYFRWTFLTRAPTLASGSPTSPTHINWNGQIIILSLSIFYFPYLRNESNSFLSLFDHLKQLYLTVIYMSNSTKNLILSVKKIEKILTEGTSLGPFFCFIGV